MEPVETFWCEPTGFARVTLRVFTGGDPRCPGRPGDYPLGHRATAVLFDTYQGAYDDDGYLKAVDPEEFDGNPTWPTVCDHCGAEPEWQRTVDLDRWYRSDRGQWTTDELPPGASFDATWLPWKGDDGVSLMVVVPPGGRINHWAVDGIASNCNLRDAADHRCWCRTGDPRAGTVHVSKDGCDTCTVGAGSIQTADWHGYLRHGRLVTA